MQSGDSRLQRGTTCLEETEQGRKDRARKPGEGGEHARHDRDREGKAMDDNRYYGVWLPDLAKNGVWFVSGATGVIFHTQNLNVAHAQAMSMGGTAQVARIWQEGKPLSIDWERK